MNFLTVVVALLSIIYLASARPSWLAGPIALVRPGELGALLQGPSSATTVLGPDGSVISASAIGGSVIASPKAGGVVTAAVAPGLVAGPILAAPALAAPLWGVPALSTPAKAILAGPSNTLISSGLSTKWIGAGLW